MNTNPHDDCGRIYEHWHAFAKGRDADGLVALYHEDAVLETPLAMSILDGRQDGILRGCDEIRHFFDEGLKRRPDDLLRWYRTGLFLTNGRVLTWEYPRRTPDGDQIDIVEVMDVEAGRIAQHRIYWGWFGCRRLIDHATAQGRGSPS